MEESLTIALDCMGGDFGPQVVVSAAISSLKDNHKLSFILVGDEAAISQQLSASGTNYSGQLQIQHASEKVEMDELPAQALRMKKDSSMRVSINLVKDGAAGACVSAGNTGALMVTARYVLKMLPGIDRPAIISALPSINRHTYMLDLGANVDCSADQLFQFAVMGSVFAHAVDDTTTPRVGLLNIGQETIKGNDQVKEAARLLESSSLNYIGFVEGDDIYCGDVDVVVCDGFVGNVSLKTSEGVAKIISHYARLEFGRNALTKMAGLIALPILNSFRKKIDPRLYNGASLLGLQGVVIKSHGDADVFAFKQAIKIACIEARTAIPHRIDAKLENLLLERPVD